MLIPRPETELLVDMAIYWAGMNVSVLDLCTGSGAAAVALKHSRQDLDVFASDISAEALKVARKNSLNINGKGKIKFYRGNLIEPFKGKRFDVIISNPPYISIDEADSLKKDLFFEPEIALFAPENGRAIIEKIIVESVDYLNEKGTLLLEMGNNQDSFVTKLGEKKGYTVSILNDYSLRQSMSRRGNCWDNAPQESLFGHMKDELPAVGTYGHAVIAERVYAWIDYYNNDR